MSTRVLTAGSPTITLTVGGVAATQVVLGNDTGTIVHATAIYVVDYPTGTTADVVVTFNKTAGRCIIDMWAGYGMASSAYDTSTSNAGDPTGTIDIPAGGFAVAQASHGASTTVAWTGLTERSDRVAEITVSAASDDFATEQVALTWKADFAAGTTDTVGVVASWGPAAASTANSGFLALM